MIRRPLVPLAIALIVAAALVAGAAFLHVRAPLLRAIPARLAGSPDAVGASPARADVLLVVSHEVIADSASAGRFDALDLSYGWINPLSQEFGPFQVRDVADGLPSPAPAVVIWSRSACHVTDEGAALALEEIVRDGAIVVLDLPPATLHPLAGFAADPSPPRSPDVWGRASGLTPEPDGPLGPWEAAQLARLDLPISFIPGSPAEDAEVLLRIDGKPAALRRRLGSGALIALLFDFARLVTSIQQGTPEPDFSVANRHSAPGDRVATGDLVAAGSLLQADVPYADLLERLAAGWIEAVRPLPGLWGYPGGAAGAVLATHDADGTGERAAAAIDREAEHELVSTSFFLPSKELDSEAVARMRGAGTEAGLRWDRSAGPGAVDDMRLGPLRLFRVERSLTKQVTWLRTLLPDDVAVRAARVHHLEWGATWAETFRELAAADIQVDSTYGAARGYPFGTGRPFRPLDESGLPLPLLEVPHIGNPAPDAGQVTALLAASRNSYHQAIVVAISADATGQADPANRSRPWPGASETARELDHRWMTLGGLGRFEAARSASSLRSTWDGTNLEIEGEAAGPAMHLVLPGATAAGRLQGVRSGEGDATTREVERMGRRAVLVPVPAGPFRVRASYGGGR